MDATPTPLRTIPLSDNTQHLIRAVVLAHKTGGDTGIRSDGALFERVVRAKRDAGGPAILGAVRAPITDEDDANWDCTIVGSGNNAVVQVTGRELEAIAWHLLECQVGSWRTDPSDTNDYRQNLVVYWKLEEASGTRYDSTPGARNLTEHATDGHGVGQRAGRNKGSAAYFDGDEGHPNYLSIVDSLPLQLGNDADWYWCAWVYCISSIPLYSIVLAKRGLTEVEYQLHVTGAGDLTVLMGVPPTGLSQVTAMKPGLAADAWHFVEFWHDSATHILYVDFDRRGVPGFFSTASAGLKSTNPLYVGYDVAGNLHQGLVDELALYSSIPPDVIRDGLYGGIRPY
jgi:hypothetical protein